MKLKSLFSQEKDRWGITREMLFSLFLTGTIIEFSQVGSGFIDGLVISRFLGADAMAAEGIVHPIFSILGIISGLLAVGMQVRCTQAIGRGNREEYSRFVSATFYVGVIVSLIITALLMVFAKPFAALLGASGNAAGLLEPAAKYLIGVCIGAPPLIMTVILAPALQLDTGRKIVQTGALIEAAADIVLDILAVKMGGGLFEVGLATAAASYLNLLYQCTFFLKKDRILHFVKPDVPVKDFLKMLANGGEKAVKRLANTVRPIVLNAVIISYGGTAAMSALSVRNNFSNFVEIFGAGIASAISLLVGVYYGEINAEGIEEVTRQKNRLIRFFPGFVGAILLIFAKQLARLYITDDSGTYDLAVFAFRVLAVQLPLQALLESRIKYLQAIHKKLNMNILIMVTRLVFVVLSALILGNMFGSYGILFCFTVSDAFALIAIYTYYAVACRKIRPTKEDFLNLPASFYLHPGNVISLDIRSLEDVSLVSKQIMLFCKGHNIDRRISYYASLSFEELASNIVIHGFPQSTSSDPMIDLRVVIAGNDLVIRLRDNCPRYDVTKEIAAVKEADDPTHNIGTRIVSNIASDITYLNTFDTNSLILRFQLNDSPAKKN